MGGKRLSASQLVALRVVAGGTGKEGCAQTAREGCRLSMHTLCHDTQGFAAGRYEVGCFLVSMSLVAVANGV